MNPYDGAAVATDCKQTNKHELKLDIINSAMFPYFIHIAMEIRPQDFQKRLNCPYSLIHH
jgi:hypothetical protein